MKVQTKVSRVETKAAAVASKFRNFENDGVGDDTNNSSIHSTIISSHYSIAMVLSIIRNVQKSLQYRGGWKGLLEHMYTVSIMFVLLVLVAYLLTTTLSLSLSSNFRTETTPSNTEHSWVPTQPETATTKTA